MPRTACSTSRGFEAGIMASRWIGGSATYRCFSRPKSADNRTNYGPEISYIGPGHLTARCSTLFGCGDTVACHRCAKCSVFKSLSNIKNEKMERVKGIEPSSSAWEAASLPLRYTRIPGAFQESGGRFSGSEIRQPVRVTRCWKLRPASSRPQGYGLKCFESFSVCA